MMKKFRLPIIGVLALFLSGCTLMMDDMPLTDEKYAVDLETVGFDEPYTQETEYGDVTYQYNDSTRILKKAALDYLFKTDGDSVLYFSDNIPYELLVQPGYYITIVSSRLFPDGLCNEVVSLEHLAGMYKMVTTKVEPEKVFDVLEYNLSMNCFSNGSNLEFLDSAEKVARGLDPNEIIAYDYSVIEEKATRSVRGGPSLIGTRSFRADEPGESGETAWTDSPDEKDVDGHSEKFAEDTYQLFRITTSNAGQLHSRNRYGELMSGAVGAALKYLSDHDIMFALSLDKESSTHVTLYTKLDKDPEKSVREQTTVERTKLILTLESGLTIGEGLDSNDPEEAYKQVRDVLYDARKRLVEASKKKDCHVMIKIPIGIPGVSVFLRVAPHFDFEFAVVGKAKIEIVMPTTTTYVKTIGDKNVTPDDKATPKKEGSYSVRLSTFELSGELSLSGGVEFNIGVGAGVGDAMVGLAGGADVTATASAKATYDVSENKYNEDETYLKFNVGLQFDARLFLGFYQQRFDIGPPVPIYDKTLYAMPSIGDKNSATCSVSSVGYSGPGGTVNESLFAFLTAQYSFASMGIFGWLAPAKFKPLMYLHYKHKGSEHNVLLSDKYGIDKSAANTSNVYEYTYEISDYQDYSDVYFIPGYSFNGTLYKFKKNKLRPTLRGEPLITPQNTYFTEKVIPDEYDFSDDADPYYYYTIVDRIKLEGAQNLKKYWKEWGLKVEIVDAVTHETVYPAAYLPVNVDSKNGNYNIKAKLKVDNDHRYFIGVTHYYLDVNGVINTVVGDLDTDGGVYVGPEENTKSAPSADFKPSVKL